ncbi:ion transport domain-containing protein [Artemisia annua]|uniref:Ion transport domain-containing protein n=1 Tax=Artemisia annua TaxID=35608 RepID=A0A2U1KZC3_ARTAN|nr:ion transport domain-containing protein [Artemisia annua]
MKKYGRLLNIDIIVVLFFNQVMQLIDSSSTEKRTTSSFGLPLNVVLHGYIEVELLGLAHFFIDSSTGYRCLIDVEEFNELCNTIALKFQKEYTKPWLKKFPFYNSSLSENLKTFVESKTFGYVAAFVLLLNLVTVITETMLDIQNNSGHMFWQKVEFIFGMEFLIVGRNTRTISEYLNFKQEGSKRNRNTCIRITTHEHNDHPTSRQFFDSRFSVERKYDLGLFNFSCCFAGH